MKFRTLGITLLIVSLGMVAIWLGQNGDERLIHHRMDQLLELASKQGPESKLQTLAKARQLRTYFAENARIQVEKNTHQLMDRQMLMGYFVRVRAAATTISVRMRNRHLTVDEKGEWAELRVTGKAVLDMGGQTDAYTERYQISLTQTDGEWLITEMRILE